MYMYNYVKEPKSI